MSGKLIILLAVLSCAQYSAHAETSTVVCYFNNWTIYRPGNGQYKVADIDPNLCTHVIYGLMGFTPNGTFQLLDEWSDIDLYQIEDVIYLKRRNRDLKVLMSIGGYSSLSANFSKMVETSTSRANFIRTTIAAIEKYGFDGLDLLWEYPGGSDKANFALLIQEARQAFSAKSLLLTAAVAAGGYYVDVGYDVPVLSQNLDMITLMEYDFHGYHFGYTGSNAPLYYSPDSMTATDQKNNVNASVKYWISRGADPAKLLLGLPFYGKTFELRNKEQHSLGAPASGPGPSGPYTKQMGVLGYNEICELNKAGGWTRVWEEYQKVPFMYKDNLWVSYDDEMSITAKVYYAKQNNLLGLSVWSLGTDDFHGTCGRRNALLNAINDALDF